MPTIPSSIKDKLDTVIHKFGNVNINRTKVPITTFYLAIAPSLPPHPAQNDHNPSISSPALTLLPVPPRSGPHVIPSDHLLFGLTHPDPDTDERTSFFLSCIPDPIGFLFHAAGLIRSHLIPSSSYVHPSQNSGEKQNEPRWRFQLIHLELEDKGGLAATSNGKIVVSLQWVGNILENVKEKKSDKQSAIKEFKGVLLHELVHVIQHDGFGSTPTWLTESIADYVRLLTHLGPPHWRKPGQGKREKGWEDGYDAGARFLSFLTGQDPDDPYPSELLYLPPPPHQTFLASPIPPVAQPTSTSHTSVAPPKTTQMPTISKEEITPVGGRASRRKRPPMPELVKLFDARLEWEKYHESWWEEMTGAPLEVLWSEYLDCYA
ncbi:hypothetical protein M231_03523 [Tremella mesenterica]|uniref:Uncharacterized protein n=1 Tax=Tremella mesenterica TaxID=5217 RepID=A0A4Q1BMW2_TREME|nr:uncharacterized protein TREMEDRAFT_60022 [Tremella mesenterica DSM 1558]EIW71078.1 hypothetical protein TREMEDRAFT_60022 [Tremella mesenterica DSM 1558]RXK39166.1 hypothetical protein M231_03523 [Tremella mesenterica]